MSTPQTNGMDGPRIRLIVGLGNPGPQYDRTRHNLGFQVADLLAGAVGAKFRLGSRGLLARGRYRGVELLLLKPTTYMNESGQAAVPLLRRKGIPAGSGLLVVHDDLDLAAGKLRLRRDGSAGGHKGVISLIQHLGTPEFGRLKIGLGRPPAGVDPVEYVLHRPDPAERELLDAAVRRAVDAALLWAAEGMESAMGTYNAAAATEEASPAEPDPRP